MATVEMKGLHAVKAKGRTYYYAWRGGPAVKGKFGTPEFHASYQEAVLGRLAPDTNRFLSVIQRYKNSADYRNLADSTRRNWGPWLDRIGLHFGELRIAAFDKPERIRRIIRQWRATYADTPRAADYGMQVLSRVCSYMVDPLGKITANPCEGIKQLYSSSRAEIIWTDVDIAQLKKECSIEIAHAVDLAAHTGLRVGDLVRLSWSHIGDDAIVMRTGKRSGKTKKQREAVIPLYQELRDVLARIPRRSPVVLTSSLKRPWNKDGLASSFADAKHIAWPEGDDLHFHDLRGTAATKFYLAGIPEREIAEMMAWDEETVSKIIRRYVSRTAAIRERIRKLDEARRL
jgi:integrase